MSKTAVLGQNCGLCGETMTGDDGIGPCKACWAIQVAHAHVSEQVAQSLQVMAEYRQALELGKSIPKMSSARAIFQKDHDLGVLRDYVQELASLRSLRASQRELRMKRELRLNLKEA
jgi:hypothetical protein